MQIKLYTKEYVPLTTLVQTKIASDFNSLTYKETLHQVGDCSFSMRVDADKVTLTNLKHYNIVEVCEDDGTVRWVGVIIYRRVLLNVVNINCYGLIYLLSKRLTGATDAFGTTAGNVASSLLSTTNSADNTQVSAGTLNNATAVSITFTRSNIFDALNALVGASGGQFRVNPNKTLDFKSSIGSDLSANVVFQYRQGLIASANILKFQVEDDSKNIITKTYGESGVLTSTQSDAGLNTNYGLFEEYKNFREITDQPTLDSSTSKNNRDSELSPLLDLSPKVTDNFEVGDVVKVQIENNLVSINASYQIIEKTVKIKGGGQRLITVRVGSNNSDFFKQLRDMRSAVNLLSRTL